MRFVLDGMLGKLARWLRLLGHEVEYDATLSDNSLLDLVERNRAVLLTSDEELCERASARRIQATLIADITEEARLAKVARDYGVELVVDTSLTRCPKCGASLARAEKSEIAGKVPATSLELYDEYWRCVNDDCGKVYWRGGHWKNIDRTLANARKLLEGS